MTRRNTIPDADLVRSARAGSRAALETLYERYLPSVWRYAYTQLHGDRHAAEDIVGETFLAAVRGLEKLESDTRPVASWLVGIARHKLGDYWRRARRHGKDSPPVGAGRARSAVPDDPQRSVEAAEVKTRVGEAMAALPDEQRVVLEWKYQNELSVREIGRRLGRTEKAAEALLYRARNSFRAVFEALQGRRTAGEQGRGADDR